MHTFKVIYQSVVSGFPVQKHHGTQHCSIITSGKQIGMEQSVEDNGISRILVDTVICCVFFKLSHKVSMVGLQNNLFLLYEIKCLINIILLVNEFTDIPNILHFF